MTAVEDTRRRAVLLRTQARSAVLQARDIKAQTRLLGEATAATEDQIAATIDQLADQRPERAERLRAMSESAREYAARERERLAHHPGGRTSRCGQAHMPAAGWPVPGPDTMPEAATITATPHHGGNLSVIGERDRTAAQLQDTVIGRIFAAGLSLRSAAGLTIEPQVCWQIEAAVDELDQVIREIRTSVFQDLPYPYSP